MNLRLTPQALAEAKRIKTWWRHNRPAAPDLFEQELGAALDRIAQVPSLGSPYVQGDLKVAVRRLLLPKTRHHVYYAIEGNEVVVLSVWGTPLSSCFSLTLLQYLRDYSFTPGVV